MIHPPGWDSCLLRNQGYREIVAAAKSWPRLLQQKDLELERELQSLNKPPVKTIQLDGDIIDCADINHQPALDHPLLKNHKIQLRPTSIPATQTKKSALVNKPLQAGFMQAGCPNGTVPIYRTTKEYLTRAKSLSHQMFSNISQINAIAPNVHVSPSINGGSEPRLFIYWTLNADKTGCFNSFCQGFVQVDRDIGPKTRFDPVSSFGGTTYDSKFAIYQDSISKNWWLVVSDKNVAIGYWPKELVPSLEIGAGDVGWGGIAMAQENENAPPLGSGQYPDGTYQHVGYFRDIHFMKDGLHPKVPTDADPVFESLESQRDTNEAFVVSVSRSYEVFSREKFRRLSEGVVLRSTHLLFMEDDEELRLLLGFAAPIARAQRLRPTSFPAPVTDPMSETWSKREACPDGTVPIHRTTKDDLERAKNLQVFVKLKETQGVKCFGVWGIGSVYNLSLDSEDQSSSGNVFVIRGPRNELNVLVAGWMVSPSINGDQLSRLYTYWIVNNGKIGCFNLLCAAFVQIDRTFAPKMPLSPVSTIGGPSYDMKVTIYQDTQTSNWWLAVTDRNITVGYWPKEMLPHLRNGAGEVGWGGTAMAATKRSPPIGSGQYPDDNYDRAAYFRNPHFTRGWLKEVVPSETDPVYEYTGQSGCYGLENGKDTKVEFWGYRFEYGGPGGECGP
ncbi:PREDICTED: uncharacterized protein LOC103335750 [Prunus mume]|uniref:Uncharacterized protein LOC103335750 n=1 Tax=Prunus mume TaxID=102107 RepID=A0ABM0PB60_PRUMU|nr:PREDICTED: uncharacterized protein LOC103335750 [Prunus mume]